MEEEKPNIICLVQVLPLDPEVPDFPRQKVHCEAQAAQLLAPGLP